MTEPAETEQTMTSTPDAGDAAEGDVGAEVEVEAQDLEADGSPRRPGRPRSARADQAIVRATLDLLVEQGYQGMSIEEVAERAGVGKATIYRRFPSKEDLVGSALNEMATKHQGPKDIPNTGSLYHDIANVMDAERLQVNQKMWPMFCRIIGEAMSTPEFLDVYRKQIIDPRRAFLEGKIRAAQEHGEIEPSISPKLILDLVTGFVLARVLFTQDQRNQGLDAPIATPDEARQILDILFFGMATPSERERCQEPQES